MATVISELIDIRDRLDSVISQLLEPSTPPSWSIPVSVLAGEPGYLNEPRLIACANGDILCIYRRGSAHVSNGATIEIRRSQDRGLTWGESSTLHAVAGRDCRNHSVGITSTGRLLVFSRTTNMTTTDKHWRHYSDDNGVTWVTEEFQPTGSCVAYGRVVETVRGLMRLCYLGNRIVAEFSNDNGLTWGSPAYPWNASQQSATFSEPFAVAIDPSRIVVVMRDDKDGGRYFWSKSADGGATWAAGPTASVARFTANVMVPAAPASLAMRSGKVHMAWDGRSPLWRGYASATDAEEFWSNPHRAWQAGVATAVSTHASVIPGGTATGAEYGYSDLLALPEGILCAWYDSKTGSGQTECRVMIQSI